MLNPLRKGGKRLTATELTDAEPDAEGGAADLPAHKAQKRTRRPLVWTRFRFGIQSKILVALLLSSILGVAVIGAHRGHLRPQRVAGGRVRAVDRIARGPEAGGGGAVPGGDEFADRLQRRIQHHRCDGGAHRGLRPIGQRDDHSRPTAGARQLLPERDDQTDQAGDRRRHRSQRGAAEFQRAEIPSGVLHRSAPADHRLAARRGRRRRQCMVGGQRPLRLLHPRYRHPLRLPGRAAAGHAGQCRLQRQEGSRPRNQYPHRPLSRIKSARRVPKSVGLQRR